jgi:MATE family multidrug resistance protein
MGLATGFMGLAAVAFLTMPRLITGLYLDLSAPDNQAVVRLAVRLLDVAALFQVVDGLQVAAHGALQGLKDTRVPMGIAALTYWGLGLPVGYLWGVRGGGGPEVLWWGLVIGLTAAAGLMVARFHGQVRRLSAGALDLDGTGPNAPVSSPAPEPSTASGSPGEHEPDRTPDDLR